MGQPPGTCGNGHVRNVANRVTSDGIGAFDVELGDFQTVGQIIDQVHKRSSPASPSSEPPERPSRRDDQRFNCKAGDNSEHQARNVAVDNVAVSITRSEKFAPR